MTSFSVTQGTVVPAGGFSAEKAAEKLRKAMKGLGKDHAPSPSPYTVFRTLSNVREIRQSVADILK